MEDDMKRTPVTDAGLRRYDHLPAAEAVRLAWTEAGPHPAYHRTVKTEVGTSMPVLARALNRLENERSA